MPEYDFPNKDNLRVVETELNPKTVQELRKKGRVCLSRKLFKNPEFIKNILKVRNKSTGQITEVPENRSILMQYTGESEYFPESEWTTIDEYQEYPRDKPNDLSEAYYVLPANPILGERFYIQNLIFVIIIKLRNFFFGIII